MPRKRIASSEGILRRCRGADAHRAEAAQKLAASASYLSVRKSPHRRTIEVRKAISSAGMVVELRTVEIREAGAIVRWQAGTGHDTFASHPTLIVGDDLDTRYEVTVISSGGNGRRIKGGALLVPSPPSEARVLHIDFEGFDAFPLELNLTRSMGLKTASVRGEWRFDVRLDSRS